MDSLTQITLGSAVAVAVMGRKVPVWQSALWGAFAGTAPDLDVVMDFGDAILNMTRHRAETHAIAYLTAASAVFAAVAHLIHRQAATFSRWWMAFWLVLITHVGIDYMTVYGTQLALPWSNYPFGQGSIFIIDPLYTAPLLIGLLACLWSRSRFRWTWNALGLLVSSTYMVWTVIAQEHVTTVAKASPPGDRIDEWLITPSPLNTFLWRMVAVSPTHYYEGWYSVFDDSPKIEWRQYDRRADLIEQHWDHPGVREVARFSKGFYRMHERDDNVYVTDIRMGFEPNYFFVFNLGSVGPDNQLDVNRPAIQEGSRPELGPTWNWLIARILAPVGPQPGLDETGPSLPAALPPSIEPDVDIAR
ncbi:metal-dependent hydrolase [Orrella marina]|uniref:Hydrolase n=1 Tax=Orrella marina TaxID=2163011 RepID=A0A2R4XNL4_9BURK|nr:metal-dependent hydrolase [Orrella marina]AWB35403.1 hydrolase [Orrella marina]